MLFALGCIRRLWLETNKVHSQQIVGVSYPSAPTSTMPPDPSSALHRVTRSVLSPSSRYAHDLACYQNVARETERSTREQCSMPLQLHPSISNTYNSFELAIPDSSMRRCSASRSSATSAGFSTMPASPPDAANNVEHSSSARARGTHMARASGVHRLLVCVGARSPPRSLRSLL